MNERVRVDLDYVTPNQSFLYPLFSEDGKKICDDHVTLTADTLRKVKETYGTYVYYLVPSSKTYEADQKLQKAYDHSRIIVDEIINAETLSEESFNRAEVLIEDIISDLEYSEMRAINLLHVVKSVDDYLYQHLINVGILSAYLAYHSHSFTQEEIKFISLGGYLIDIGMMKIDRQLLKTDKKYSVTDLQKLKRHPQLGYELLKNIKGINPIVLQTVLFHHEQYDGKGYYNLPYEDLPVPPKIASICDTYDACVSKRPYRDALEVKDALQRIINSIYSVYDYRLVSNFLNIMGKRLNNGQVFYKVGDFCELSTGEMALIIDFNSSDLLKPKIMIFCRIEKYRDRVEMKFYSRPIEVNLLNDKDRLMVRLINDEKKVEAMKDHLLKKKLFQDILKI